MQSRLNQNLVKSHAQELLAQGLDYYEIGERLDLSDVCHFVTTEADPVGCHRCEEPLSYHTAFRIGQFDFCRPCRKALFADSAAAAASYPELFEEVVSPS